MSLVARLVKPAVLIALLAFSVVAQRAEPSRSVDVPRRLNEIRRDLRLGQLWVAQSGERLTAIRVSLELDNRVVGNVTLQSESGQPVVFQERNNQRLERLPAAAVLTTYLRGLREEAQSVPAALTARSRGAGLLGVEARQLPVRQSEQRWRRLGRPGAERTRLERHPDSLNVP